jgi:hypothetical protein
LWASEGVNALLNLRGRGLRDETIRTARLGWTLKAAGVPWQPPGVVIPWFADRLALVKIRPPAQWREWFPKDNRPPKYIEGYRDNPMLYPGSHVIRPGFPAIITEGELDALLLAQELTELASVVTLGSASFWPTPAILGSILGAWPWFVATDNDEAGNTAAKRWPAWTRRVRPPEPFKDWTEAHQAGVSLRHWWASIDVDLESAAERLAIRTE